MKEIIGKIKEKITFCRKNVPPVSISFTEYLTSFNDASSDSDLTTEEFETACKSLRQQV